MDAIGDIITAFQEIELQTREKEHFPTMQPDLPVIEIIEVQDFVAGYQKGLVSVRGELGRTMYEAFLLNAPAAGDIEKKWDIGFRTFRPPATVEAKTTLLDVLPEKRFVYNVLRGKEKLLR